METFPNRSPTLLPVPLPLARRERDRRALPPSRRCPNLRAGRRLSRLRFLALARYPQQQQLLRPLLLVNNNNNSRSFRMLRKQEGDSSNNIRSSSNSSVQSSSIKVAARSLRQKGKGKKMFDLPQQFMLRLSRFNNERRRLILSVIIITISSCNRKPLMPRRQLRRQRRCRRRLLSLQRRRRLPNFNLLPKSGARDATQRKLSSCRRTALWTA